MGTEDPRFPWWWGAGQRWPQKGRRTRTGGTNRGARVGGWRFMGWGRGAQEQGEA